ncbi:hypothetical protein WN943_027453 [Citrus x changshan-huyou]
MASVFHLGEGITMKQLTNSPFLAGSTKVVHKRRLQQSVAGGMYGDADPEIAEHDEEHNKSRKQILICNHQSINTDNQEELQQLLNPNLVFLLESNEQQRLPRSSLRICGTNSDMVSEPAPASNQNNTSCNFVIPIKLDQSNFVVWRTEVLTSIKWNGIEGFITGANDRRDQYLVQDADANSPSNAGSESRIDNPAFSASIRADQLLLS